MKLDTADLRRNDDLIQCPQLCDPMPLPSAPGQGAFPFERAARMFSDGHSFSNSNSFFFGADDAKVRSLPLLFRYGVPGFQNGWPPPC